MSFIRNKKGSTQLGLMFSVLISIMIVFSAFSFLKYSALQQEQAESYREITDEITTLITAAQSEEIKKLKGVNKKIGNHEFSAEYNVKEIYLDENLNVYVIPLIVKIDNKTKEYLIERSGYYEKVE